MNTQPGTAAADGRQHVLLVVASVAVGGMETYCVNLAQEFVRRGLRVSVMLSEGEKFEPVALRFMQVGAQVFRLDADGRHGRMGQVRRLLAYRRLLHELAPDVVHMHLGGATGGLATALATRRWSRAAFVLTEHDIPKARVTARGRLTRRLLDPRVHALVACSRTSAVTRRERLGVWASPARFAAIQIGVAGAPEGLAARPAARAWLCEAYGVLPAEQVIGCVVRLVPGKGLDTLLAAFSLLSPGERGLRLVLVGDGALRQSLERQAAELGLTGLVVFAGYHDDPTAFIQAMDVFVLAVPAGTGSVALMEAMLQGVPAVITFGGPDEAVVPGETGYWAQPNNPPDLADRIRMLVDDPGLRARLGANASAHIQRHFTMSRVADDVLELYDGVMQGAVPHRLRVATPTNYQAPELKQA